MKKTHVTAHIKNNRLYFKIVGNLTKKELDALYTDVRFCVADLKPGFDVITDLSECTLASLAGLPTFRKISSYLITNQVGHVIRILDESNLIFKQLLNFAARFQGYESISVSSIEDAEDLLAKLPQRDSIRIILHNQPVRYSFAEVQGEGTIIDMSLSGCAIQSSTNLPQQDQEVTVALTFDIPEDEPKSFELHSKIVRVEEDSFAVIYTDLNTEEKDRLWKCILRQTEKEVKF